MDLFWDSVALFSFKPNLYLGNYAQSEWSLRRLKEEDSVSWNSVRQVVRILNKATLSNKMHDSQNQHPSATFNKEQQS